MKTAQADIEKDDYVDLYDGVDPDFDIVDVGNPWLEDYPEPDPIQELEWEIRRLLQGAGFTVDKYEAGNYAACGFYDPLEVLRWRQNGFSFDLWDAMWIFRDKGFTPEEAGEWFNKNIPAEEAYNFRNMGYSPEEAQQLYFTGFTSEMTKKIMHM